MTWPWKAANWKRVWLNLRHTWLPLGLAIVATVVAIVLSLAFTWRGKYDPMLAILTLTVIAVIWYTYFTFRAVHPLGRTHLDLALEHIYKEGHALRPLIRNLSGNVVNVRITLDVWWGELFIDLGRFYDGHDEISLDPHSGIGGWLELKKNGEGNEILARMLVEWWDSTGRRGTTGPRHWLIALDKGLISAVIASENISRRFEGLKKPQDKLTQGGDS